MQWYVILIILFWHWLADFVFQDEKDAINKWHSMSALYSHTLDYSASFFFPIWILLTLDKYNIFGGLVLSAVFMIVTFICHTTTDYFTSKWTHKLWDEGKTHDFFVAIGLDQFLHGAQLMGTYVLILYIF